MKIDARAGLAFDAAALDQLKRQAQEQPGSAVKGAAVQFEAMFVNTLLKTMRESLPQDGLFSSEATRLYTGMLDQQLSQTVAARGLGLADLIVKQLERHNAATAQRTGETAPGGAAPAVPTTTTPSGTPAATRPDGTPKGFVDALLPHAKIAERATGIPARYILGQAALETGWGRHEIRGADGTPSHNVFGIKAGPGWKGRTVEVTTTEYVNGEPRKVVQKFRAYDSYAEAFTDWGKLLVAAPRYAVALAARSDPTRYAQGLQAGGYATDPRYAEKLTRVFNHAELKRAST